MTEQTEIFIESVRKYTYLYDSSHEYYKNVLKKAEAWNSIGQELNMTNEAAKTKWKNLRDSYMRFKRSAKGQTGQAKKYRNWPWSSQMSFLDSTLEHRAQSSNITQDTRVIENISPSSEFESVLVNCSSETTNQVHSPAMLPPPTPRKKVKAHSEGTVTSDTEVDKVIEYLQSKKSQVKHFDVVDHLFLGYAATFKTFRPRTQAMLKVKLATLFPETEISELQELEASQMTSPAHSNSSGFETFNYVDVTQENTRLTFAINTDNSLTSVREAFQSFNANNN